MNWRKISDGKTCIWYESQDTNSEFMVQAKYDRKWHIWHVRKGQRQIGWCEWRTLFINVVKTKAEAIVLVEQLKAA